MANPDYETILEQQLRMNALVWARLRQHGVTEGTLLRLDFSYKAPNRAAAHALCAFLRAETDYDLRVEPSGSILRRKWTLEGTTQPTAVSQIDLDEWVAYMVIAGTDHSCTFDGWGTEV